MDLKTWYLKLLYYLYPASEKFPEYKLALNLAEIYNCRQVLDVGAGTGNLAKLLVNNIDRYVGIDKFTPNFRHPKTIFIKGDGYQPPVDVSKFDCVFFVNSFFYIFGDKLEGIKNYYSAKNIIIIDIHPKYIDAIFMDSIERLHRLPPVELAERLKEIGFEIKSIIPKQTYAVVFVKA